MPSDVLSPFACMSALPAISLHATVEALDSEHQGCMHQAQTKHHSFMSWSLQGWTALHIAARSDPDCVHALLSYAPPTYLWTVDRPQQSEETPCATVPATKRRRTG